MVLLAQGIRLVRGWSRQRVAVARSVRRGFQFSDYMFNAHRFSKEAKNTFSGMELVFLGTSAGGPQPNRGTTSIAMRLSGHSQAGGNTWLFDAGEGTQRQLLSSNISHARVERIFVSHMHGDHVWGLPSVIVGALVEQGEKRSLHVYGPVGLHGLLVASLGYAECKLGPLADIVVHELVETEDELGDLDAKASINKSIIREPILKSARDGSWTVYEDDHFKVTAAPVRHTVPCFGYVVDEQPRKRKIDAKLCAEAGLPPGRAYRDLQEGRDARTPDGKLVRVEDVTRPPAPPRRVVIVGDTNGPSAELRRIGKNADLVIHEATMSDEDRGKAFRRGHSTPSMAGSFARDVQAKCLVLTHLSGRFLNIPRRSESTHNDGKVQSVDVLTNQARRTVGNSRVVAAQDFLCISIPLGGFPVSLTEASHNRKESASSAPSRPHRTKVAAPPPSTIKPLDDSDLFVDSTSP